MKKLQKVYTLTNPFEINMFVAYRKGIDKILYNLHHVINHHFGKVTPSLEVIVDYEFPTWQQICVSIPVKEHSSDSHAKYVQIINWVLCQKKYTQSIMVNTTTQS